MIRRLALILAVFMFVFLAWALFLGGDDVSITKNGHEIAKINGPFGIIIGVWSFILTLVILFCAAILLAFVLAGVGLVILGGLVLVGLVLIGIALPFLLPLLIPLFIIWVFCSIVCRLLFK
ncbi:MAG: hypothetical protein A2167_00880 [Planctomycetes bacterium RBG_13_46_10]|nr:MAG: hypothetical protein A2167_00880 [Planctomycetes bacterium RBG_13_46_10]